MGSVDTPGSPGVGGRAAGGERARTPGWLSPGPPRPRGTEGQALGAEKLALSAGWVSHRLREGPGLESKPGSR